MGWGPATNAILWSEGAYARGPGDRPERITCEVYRQHLHPDDPERAMQRNVGVRREKGTFKGEYRILTAP